MNCVSFCLCSICRGDCCPSSPEVESESCHTCQCVVTQHDVDRELGPDFLEAPENILGTVKGTDEEVTIEPTGTYVAEGVTINVRGHLCVEW